MMMFAVNEIRVMVNIEFMSYGLTY